MTAAFNREVFKPVQARYVRMTISAATSSEPCLDELSIFAGEENVGLLRRAIATASSNLPGYPIHQIKHLNDGVFGNSISWISNEFGKGWAQIELPEPSLITSIEWSRDRQSIPIGWQRAIVLKFRLMVSSGRWSLRVMTVCRFNPMKMAAISLRWRS